MTKSYRKIITVRGASSFPIDMLRYDHAWPRTEQDSNLIRDTFDYVPGNVEIELYCMEMPNRGRWASFGWEVIRTERAP